ncbi:hypothetical protein Fluta_1741 [Fluviicola taffensis DSM 16823]|uniref:Alanyl-tRNA synthetase n=2 Tax=Fluviicola TaxID=332102 RepID=F2IHG7_FLUTR|nr:hypothetical protein Fluta_1741 [Fluviicola taffensis DSM 16823]
MELGRFNSMKEEKQTAPNQPIDEKALKRKKWLKRVGVAGFLFFLIKGLVWIAIALFAWKGCS